MTQARPIPDSYWVSPDFLAGEYPGSRHETEAREKIHSLLSAGMTFFVDLTEEVERNVSLKPYKQLLDEEAAKLGKQVEYRRIPIRDIEVPSPETMTTILDTIDKALAEDRKVYVHCWGGIGRTGTVVGCYMVRHGMSGDAAIRKIAELREGTPDASKTAPQTQSQRNMILNWH